MSEPQSRPGGSQQPPIIISPVAGEPAVLYYPPHRGQEPGTDTEAAAVSPTVPRSQPDVHDTSEQQQETKERKISLREDYESLNVAGKSQILWAALVLGLAAGVLSKRPPRMLFIAAAYNVGAGAAQFFALGIPSAKPVSESNARPQIWFTIFGSLWFFIWGSASSFILVMRDAEDTRGISEDRRRGRGGLGDLLKGIGKGMGNVHVTVSVRAMAIACGSFGVVAFLFSLLHVWSIYDVSTRKYSEAEKRKIYQELHEGS